MTLLYSSTDRETHSSKTDRCMTLALWFCPAGTVQHRTGPPFFSHFVTEDCCSAVLCRHQSGVESALYSASSSFTLQPPFSGGPTVRKLPCPVPSSVSVLPASNLGRYHSFCQRLPVPVQTEDVGPL